MFLAASCVNLIGAFHELMKIHFSLIKLPPLAVLGAVVTNHTHCQDNCTQLLLLRYLFQSLFCAIAAAAVPVFRPGDLN